MQPQNATTFDVSKIKLKKLSENPVIAFFQRLTRRLFGKWYSFSAKRPRLSAFIYKLFFFLVFSVGVTVLQFVMMTFLPYAFDSLNDGPWGFPEVAVQSAGGQPYVLFGDASGLGYFIAFEIAVFVAQCINFPLQRNVTYKSHGNPYFQAMWYFIGWVLVSVFTNALWGIANCYLLYWGAPDAAVGFVKTLLTGFISFVIFFFIFMLIFPDRQKQAQKARKKCDRLKAKGKQRKIISAEERANNLERLAEIENLRLKAAAALSLAEAGALRFDKALNELAKLRGSDAEDEKIDASQKTVGELYEEAVAAAEEYDAVYAAYMSAKEANAVKNA